MGQSIVFSLAVHKLLSPCTFCHYYLKVAAPPPLPKIFDKVENGCASANLNFIASHRKTASGWEWMKNFSLFLDRCNEGTATLMLNMI